MMTSPTLSYRWNTGSIPPPDYYEYEIRVAPAGQGFIRLRPGYPNDRPPTWTEPLLLFARNHELLLQAANQLPVIVQGAGSHVGGVQERLSRYDEGKTAVELDLNSELGRRVVDMIKALVPDEGWKRLFDRYEAYRRKQE